MSAGCVVVFGREPVPGRAKTRLAATIGERAAARVYGVMLEHTVRTATAAARRPVLSLAEPASPGWSPPLPVEVEVQAAGNLGTRLHDAFRRRFADGEERVVVVGSDCPGITAGQLETAISALDTAPLVLAPAADGGYWLVAQRPPGVDLFSGVPWSTPDTLEATRRRLVDLGVAWRELVELRDVDTAGDLEAALRDPATPPELAARLAACLSSGRGG